MGNCISPHKRKQKIKDKNQSSKSRKGWVKTVSPVPGAPHSTINKEQINGFRYSSAETTINNLVHMGSEMSTTNGKADFASVNFNVTEIQRAHTKSESYGSKDEAYFDSVAVWESDCDEDFFSINGDILPSAGNTMSLPNSVQGTPRPSIASLKDRMITVENKERIVPVDDDNGMVSLENEDKMIPVENENIMISVENKDRMVPVENDYKMVSSEKEDRIVPAENKDGIIPDDNKNRKMPVEKKKKLKELFMETLSSEDNMDLVRSKEPQLNHGSKDDGIGATFVKYEGSKGPGQYQDTVKDVNIEGANEHDLDEKQMMKCCLPLMTPNGTVNGKRSSSPNRISKENK